MQVGNINIGIVKYYYIASSFASYLLIFIINSYHQKLQKYGECPVSEFILERILLLFPVHWLSMNLAENVLNFTKARNDLTCIVTEAMEEEDHSLTGVRKYLNKTLQLPSSLE